MSPSSEGNSYFMVKVDAFTHYVALNPVSQFSVFYNHHPHFLKLASGTHPELILIRDKNPMDYINSSYESVTESKFYSEINSPFRLALLTPFSTFSPGRSNLKIGTLVPIPNFTIHKGIYKKL